MPFARANGNTDWWVMGQDYKVVAILPTSVEAFNKAIMHNKEHDVPAVYVMGLCAKNGKWRDQHTQAMAPDSSTMRAR